MSPNPYENVNAYNRHQTAAVSEAAASGNSRETDARALLLCAGKLDEVKALMDSDPKSKENLRLYGDAVRQNQRLWTIFQIALTNPDNQLPDSLKVTLLNLSRYVDTTSFRAVGKFQPNLIDSLVNINRIIAAGLSKKPPENAAGTQPIEQAEVPVSLMTSA